MGTASGRVMVLGGARNGEVAHRELPRRTCSFVLEALRVLLNAEAVRTSLRRTENFLIIMRIVAPREAECDLRG